VRRTYHTPERYANGASSVSDEGPVHASYEGGLDLVLDAARDRERRTVEKHLGNAYTKLEIASRNELQAALAGPGS
jgi:hypothetical protein